MRAFFTTAGVRRSGQSLVIVRNNSKTSQPPKRADEEPRPQEASPSKLIVAEGAVPRKSGLRVAALMVARRILNRFPWVPQWVIVRVGPHTSKSDKDPHLTVQAGPSTERAYKYLPPQDAGQDPGTVPLPRGIKEELEKGVAGTSLQKKDGNHAYLTAEEMAEWEDARAEGKRWSAIRKAIEKAALKAAEETASKAVEEATRKTIVEAAAKAAEKAAVKAGMEAAEKVVQEAATEAAREAAERVVQGGGK